MDFDPCDDEPEHLFDDDPAPPPLSLGPVQQSELADRLRCALRARECDGSLRAARRWALGEGLPWARLHHELDAHGAYCDCELLGVLFPDGWTAAKVLPPRPRRERRHERL